MRQDYIPEVNEILSLLVTEVQQAKQEADELDTRFVAGKEKSPYPLGKKFLLNRGHGLTRIIDRLDNYLKDHY